MFRNLNLINLKEVHPTYVMMGGILQLSIPQS